MRRAGEHRGVKWSADTRALAELTVEGRTITKGFDEMPTDEALASLAADFINNTVDGLQPLPEARVLAAGDSAPLISGGSDDMAPEPAKKKKK